jgi:hypothetical protein
MAYHRSCVHVIEPRGGAACTGYDVGHELEARQAGKGWLGHMYPPLVLVNVIPCMARDTPQAGVASCK